MIVDVAYLKNNNCIFVIVFTKSYGERWFD